MKRFAKLLVASASAVFLVACGGGGDSAPAQVDVVDKYVGPWNGACVVFSDGTSARYVLTLAKLSPTVITGTNVANAYPNSTCFGPGTSYVEPGNFSISLTVVGSKAMQGVVADKVIGTLDGRAVRDVMYADATVLRFGGGAPYDAEGYSNTWSGELIYTR
jgi:hypothetical protein